MSKLQEIAEKLRGISPTPVLDASFFLQKNPNPTHKEVASFVARRQAKEPVAKIIEQKGFWNLILKTTTDTLDPRPDSETVIEAILNAFPDRKRPLRILDVGTGTGCLLLALLTCYPNAQGVGIDKSKKALSVAAENGKGFAASFKSVDFNDATAVAALGQFDIIISNPPYIPTADIETLDESVRLYDPLPALDGGADGLDAYRALAKNLRSSLTADGALFLEIGKGQEEDVRGIFENEPWLFVSSMRDLCGVIRVLCFQKNN